MSGAIAARRFPSGTDQHGNAVGWGERSKHRPTVLGFHVLGDGGPASLRELVPPYIPCPTLRFRLILRGRCHVDGDVHPVFAAAKKDAYDRADVAVIAAPGQGDVTELGIWLFVGSRSNQAPCCGE